jgi:hypothetical protein
MLCRLKSLYIPLTGITWKWAESDILLTVPKDFISQYLVAQFILVMSFHSCVLSEFLFKSFIIFGNDVGARGSVVVKALCYKLEGRGFDTR